MILVDTTIWIGLLRDQDEPPVVRLRELLNEGQAAVASVIVQEILQGASSPANLDRLRGHFLALPMLEPRDHARMSVIAYMEPFGDRRNGASPGSA